MSSILRLTMSLVRGVPLYQVTSRNLSAEQAMSILNQDSDLALRLAKHGLVHCDLNEFNLLVDLSGIQHKALSTEHDPYVRHSSLSVAAETDGELANLSREQLEERARQRVKQQLETQKKKGRQQGAFRKSNSNKTYLKGKRVYQEGDFGI